MQEPKRVDVVFAEKIPGATPGDTLVLVLCGPHLNRGFFSPQPHRVLTGIALSKANGIGMIVVGDAWKRRDLDFSLALAAEAGVDARGIYDAQARTISDIRAVLDHISTAPEYAGIAFMVIVTDWWHMDRTLTYLEGEWAKHPQSATRELVFVQKPVFDGLDPKLDQLEAEIKGIDDYLSDRPYDPVVGDWTGKPVLPRTESPDGDANEGS